MEIQRLTRKMGKIPPLGTVILVGASVLSKAGVYLLADTSPQRFSSGLAYDTILDIIAGSDMRLQAINELTIKPYGSYVFDSIENTRNNSNTNEGNK